jgi:hypothetical protein
MTDIDDTRTRAGDLAAARCCGSPATAAAPVVGEQPVSSPCCGTAAQAEQAGSCCGAEAKADAVAAGQGCCG